MYRNQVTSQQVVTIKRYSASTLDRETVFCFLVFQDIDEFPRNIQYLVVNRCVSGHLDQSASQKAFSCSDLATEKKSP